MAVVNHPDPPHSWRDAEGNVDWPHGEHDELEEYIAKQGPGFAEALARAEAEYDNKCRIDMGGDPDSYTQGGDR